MGWPRLGRKTKLWDRKKSQIKWKHISLERRDPCEFDYANAILMRRKEMTKKIEKVMEQSTLDGCSSVASAPRLHILTGSCLQPSFVENQWRS